MNRKRPSTPSDPSSGPISVEPYSEARTTETEVIVAPPSAIPSRPVLTLLSGVNAGQVFSIERNDTIIGRARDAWVRLDDVGISRHHARVSRISATTFTVEDTGSTNGVYVNGHRVERVELAAGDQVQIGSEVLLRFSLVDMAEETLARQLFESSTRDALTGAFNRKYFMGRLASEVAYAERHKTRLALLLFDLDLFKKVNDAHGHIAGDAVLRHVGMVVARLLRAEDVFARYGGEEFTVLVRGIGRENVLRLAQRIRRTVAESRLPGELRGIKVTLSIGMAVLDESPASTKGGAVGLLGQADARMSVAKERGRNCVVSE
jgi:two-component system cell cycle response regulator